MPAPARNRLLLFGQQIRYLLKATFSSDIAAPLPASLPVDVGGPLTVVDTNSIMSQSGGRFVINGTAVVNDRLGPNTTFSRQRGRALLLDCLTRTTILSGSARMAWAVTDATTTTDYGIDWFSTTQYRIRTNLVVVDTITIGSGDSSIAIIMRSTGAFLLMRSGLTGPYTLAWIYDVGTSALYAHAFVLQSGAHNFATDNFRVLDLAPLDSRFATDTGLATSRLTSPAAGTTTTHSADALIELTFSYNGTAMYFQYRRTSATNSWEVDADTGTVYLYQVVAGVYTSRGSSGSTFTATNTYRVVIVAEGNVHKVYVNNTLKVTYTDAGNFQNTATGISVDAVSASMSEVIAWPRTVSLPNV